ncbi:MAG: hypothetical protein AAGI45_17805 [Cyanobacteria bacterium P01_H01_bin.26]
MDKDLAAFEQMLNQKLEPLVELSRRQSAQISELQEQLRQATSNPATWLTPEAAYQQLGHNSKKALYQAIDAGHYRSGTEIQKRGRRYLVNVAAIEARYTKEQTRKRVC